VGDPAGIGSCEVQAAQAAARPPLRKDRLDIRVIGLFPVSAETKWGMPSGACNTVSDRGT
jgi:hypothetical protein